MDQTRYKVVLVDDNVATLTQGKNLLQAFYKVYTVQSATTLFENLEHDVPDLILLDVEMPEMNGFEAIKKLKSDKRFKDIPVIFLTAKSDEESEQEGFNLGAVDYITKPFSGPLLQKRISNQILYMRVQNAVKDYSDNLEVMVDEITKANKRTRVLLDKTPLCARLWDTDYNMVDCNEAAIELFGFRDKTEALERYSELYPEFQPDGQRSTEKVAKCINKAFEDGSFVFDWTYKMLDGTFMPAEVVLVRVEYEDGYAVAGYTRDMREHNRMIGEIEYRNSLLQATNRAAAILLDSDVDSFENALYQSMKLLAEAVDIDRVRIWKNHTQDGQLYCTQLYEWSETAEPQQGKEITINVSYSERIPGWEEVLSSGNCINSLVRNMSPVEQERLSSQGIVSILAVPVFIKKDYFWGFIGFNDCKRERIFTEEEESILRSGGMLFADALLRNEMVADIRDTAEQLKVAMEKILEDEERMQLMLDAMPLACRLLGREYEFIDCNREALSLFGVANKEEYREKYENFIPEFQPCGRRSQELKMEYLDKAFEEGYVRFDWVYQKLDSELLPCEVTMIRVMYKGEYIIAGYARDLREQKAVIEEMRRAEIAEESNKAKSRFLANMSHEIRTPMNSIMGFAELALDMPDSAAVPQVRDYLQRIKDSTKWLLHIINDILDISKIESGRIDIENVPFDMRDVFARCQSVILPDIKEKGLDFRVNEERLPGKQMLGDPVRLFQALMNLLSNAVKFTNTGTIEFTSMIKNTGDYAPPLDGGAPRTEEQGGWATVYFEVKDSGIGMSHEQVSRVFEPFIQADSSTTRDYGGTGLGLSITKSIVELMGGQLSVSSTPGVGSVFSFEIIFKTVDMGEDSSENGKNAILEKPNFDGVVLICDDNPMNQEVICEHLARVGLRTIVAENGKIGVEMVEKRKINSEKQFDLVFMDIFMPVMDGIEATSKILELDPEIPIVAMTANIMVSDIENYKKRGMSDCLGKPFTSQDLWRILLKYLTPLNSGQWSGGSCQETEPEAGGEWPADSAQGTEDRGVVQGVGAGEQLTGIVEDDSVHFDEELQKKLLISFVKNNQKKHIEIDEAIADGDLERAHRLAHSLKGNAGLIGKNGLQRAAAEVEALLKSGTIPIPTDKASSLKAELEMVIEELNPLLTEPDSRKAAQTLNSDQVMALFEELEIMLENRDTECLTYINDIRSVQGAEELANRIEEFDFKLALQTLAELMRKWK